ncbi:hypothetical protein [Shewanella benthica]|uniref:hypothetical protein n=1 Tax=Shewanella benthica TaxID=43661 RepID=UPI00031AFD70|nr:hypothetical protein [Shewanella benthica]
MSVHPGPINTDMAAQGGMTEVAEPTSVVAEGIVTSLSSLPRCHGQRLSSCLPKLCR